MKTVENENETVIYPMLSEDATETEDDFCIVLGNTFTLINGLIVDEDDLQDIVNGLEKAIEILSNVAVKEITQYDSALHCKCKKPGFDANRPNICPTCELIHR